MSITATFFAGPALALADWMMAQLWGFLWPAVCICALTEAEFEREKAKLLRQI